MVHSVVIKMICVSPFLAESGAPRAKLVAPYFTPQWGDIPAKRWRIHPRPKAVAFCCRGKTFEVCMSSVAHWKIKGH
jgi:hypothetical protein